MWNGTISSGATAIITFKARVSCTLTSLKDTEWPDTIANHAAGTVGPYSYTCAASVVPIKPDLTISAMEVTQAIQNLENDMRLIYEKETYVRVYLDADYVRGGTVIDGCDIPNVTVELEGPGGETLEPLNGPISVKALGGQTRPTLDERDTLTNSLYFRLPRSWRQQDYTLTACVNPDKDRPDALMDNNEEDEHLQFVSTQTRYFYIRRSSIRPMARISRRQTTSTSCWLPTCVCTRWRTKTARYAGRHR